MESLTDIQKIEKEVDKQFSSLEKQIGYLFHSQLKKNYKTIIWGNYKEFAVEYGNYWFSLISVGIGILSWIIGLFPFVNFLINNNGSGYYILGYLFSFVPLFFFSAAVGAFLMIIELMLRLESTKKRAVSILPNIKKNFVLLKILKNLEISDKDEFIQKIDNICKIDEIDEIYTLIDFKNTPSSIVDKIPNPGKILRFFQRINDLKELNDSLEKFIKEEFVMDLINTEIQEKKQSVSDIKDTIIFLLKEGKTSLRTLKLSKSFLKEKEDKYEIELKELESLEIKKQTVQEIFGIKESSIGNKYPSIKEIIEEQESKKYQIIGEESRDKILKGLKLIGEAQYSVKPILPYKEQLKMQSLLEINQSTQKFIAQH